MLQKVYEGDLLDRQFGFYSFHFGFDRAFDKFKALRSTNG
jgi:hypothetical protein